GRAHRLGNPLRGGPLGLPARHRGGLPPRFVCRQPLGPGCPHAPTRHAGSSSRAVCRPGTLEFAPGHARCRGVDLRGWHRYLCPSDTAERPARHLGTVAPGRASFRVLDGRALRASSSQHTRPRDVGSLWLDSVAVGDLDRSASDVSSDLMGPGTAFESNVLRTVGSPALLFAVLLAAACGKDSNNVTNPAVTVIATSPPIST